jgi:ABC-2 type transport system ATP-binding protein
LGPNGAGKSTTINMLCTILAPTSGKGTVAGHDISTEPDAVRKSIGLVFQDPSLDDQLTARENLNIHGLLYGMPQSEIDKRITEVLELVELSDRADSRVKFVSGGMKRRLEIARGLIHYPTVLFLDEPTIGLDPQTRKHIWDYILKLKQQQKMSIIMTTHYMEEAEEVCDRIAIIDRGKIVALDTPRGLRSMIGGESIVIYTPTPKKVAERCPRTRESRKCLPAKEYEDRVILTVKNAGKELPEILRKTREAGIEITEVEIHKPTLNDVFLHLTGKTIREEEVSNADLIKNRQWGPHR